MQLRPAFLVDRDKFFALLAGNTFCRLLRSDVGPAYGRAGIRDDVGKLPHCVGVGHEFLLSWLSKTAGQLRKESLQRRGMKY